MKVRVDEMTELRGEEGHNTIEANERAKKKKNSKFFTFHNNLVVSKYMNENFLQIRSEHIERKEISRQTQKPKLAAGTSSNS